MKELQQCLITKRKIDKKNEKIYALRAVVLAPRNQVITDMPRAKGNTENPLDTYLLRLEKLQQQKDNLLKYQADQWKKVQRKAQMTEQETYLIYLRVIKGFEWKMCVNLTNKKYSGMNENKAYRIYRKINEIN